MDSRGSSPLPCGPVLPRAFPSKRYDDDGRKIPRKTYSTPDKAIRKSGHWDYPPGAHPIIPDEGIDITKTRYWSLPEGGVPIMPQVNEWKRWKLPSSAPLPSYYDEQRTDRPPATWCKTTQDVPRPTVSNLGHSRDYATHDNPSTRLKHQEVMAKVNCLQAITNQLARDDRVKHLEKLGWMLDRAMDYLADENDDDTKVSDPDASSSDGEDENAGLQFVDKTYTVVDGKQVAGWQGQYTWRRDGIKREQKAKRKAAKKKRRA